MDGLVFILTPISGRLTDKYGSKILSVLGLAFDAAALIWFFTLNAKSSYGTILISLLLFGIGIAMFAPAITSSKLVPFPQKNAE
jgi:MFS family permease